MHSQRRDHHPREVSSYHVTLLTAYLLLTGVLGTAKSEDWLVWACAQGEQWPWDKASAQL